MSVTTLHSEVRRLALAVAELQTRVRSLEDTRDRLIKLNKEIANGR
jgi:hypothetical protein